MLAEYRAKGGRIRQREVADPFNSAACPGNAQNRNDEAAVKGAAKADGEEEKTSKQNDTSVAPKVRRVR